MTVGVGDDVAATATLEQPRAGRGWHSRFIVAFVAVTLMLLGSVWSDGLRASTFEELRVDVASGSVQEWYAADSLSKGDFETLKANQSTPQDVVVDENGVTHSTPMDGSGELAGGILVWRTQGHVGWKVAAADADLRSADGFGTEATPESKALVKQLRDGGVTMRPFDFGAPSGLGQIASFGGVLVFIVLVSGPAPRVGTRWFWFWLMLNGPLALGFIAYAVMELIGFRRRPDPPLTKRLSGWVGFIGAFVLSLALAGVAEFLRSRGVPLPL